MFGLLKKAKKDSGAIVSTATHNNTGTLTDEAFFNELRKKDFSRLDKLGQVYLDYTGGNLYPSSLVEAHHKMLMENVLGNPHSTNPTSQMATQMVESTREKVLSYFNAGDDYIFIFTQNASGALKIIGECYPFTDESHFVLLSDNHNSVNGIREFCKKKGGTTDYVPVQYEDLQLNEATLMRALDETPTGVNKLFAFPAQSNVTGVKHDLKWISIAQSKGFDVLLDAAAFVPTSRLDLSVVKPDFISISFYKIFGYPTGIGGLLVKKSTFPKLVKPWFAGGTVTLVSIASQGSFLAYGHERFEDGTINYNGIPAIKMGLEYIESIGIDRLSARMKSLTEYLILSLKQLKHSNGASIIKIFGPEDIRNRGSNVIMNFFDANGNKFPIELIEKMANDKKISVRSGCFCNPGIDEINNCITTEEMSRYFMSHTDGNYYDMISYLGKMRGAIRVSVGMATNKQDIDSFIQLMNELKDKTA